MTFILARSLLLICAGLLPIVSPDQDSPINTLIGQTFNLARLMKANSTILLNTYLSHQGSPFSDSGFDARRLRYEGVPTAAIPFLEWRTLSHVKRVERNYEAYTVFAEFLQLVRDDQFALNPTKVELLDMLKVTRLRIQGLLSNLTSIMSALGAPPAALTDPLMLESVEADTFEKKVRGYVVCHTYKEWIDRTVKDFSLLSEKFPA